MSPQLSDAVLARFALLPAARPLLARLRGAGNVYLVGGAVRDLLLDRTPLDLDLVVEGELEPVTALLGAPVRVHDRFGTCRVTLDGFNYDLAMARRETYARPGALPEVSPATIDEDLGRRDFTVNALAVGLGGARRGEIVAPAGALEDLSRRTLRILHDASFIDDPTRLLRLARYGARLSFTVQRRTLAFAGRAVAGGALATVSGPRLGAELRLLAGERDPIDGFTRLRALGVDEGIADGFGLPEPDLGRRALALLPSDGDAGTLVMAAACSRIAPGELAPLLDRLAFAAGPRDAIVAAASRARDLAGELSAPSSASQIAAAVGSGSPELVALAGALGGERGARSWLSRLRYVELEIDGDDLLGAGVARGPAVGAGLRAALAAKLDGTVHGRAQELDAAVRAASASG